jgi:hypothetical protein
VEDQVTVDGLRVGLIYKEYALVPRRRPSQSNSFTNYLPQYLIRLHNISLLNTSTANHSTINILKMLSTIVILPLLSAAMALPNPVPAPYKNMLIPNKNGELVYATPE